MSDAPPFGNDVLPALQTLLRHLVSQIKVLVLIFLVLNPYNGFREWVTMFHNSFHEWVTMFPSYAPAYLLLIMLALYGGYGKILTLQVTNALPSATTPAGTTGAISAVFFLWLTYYVYHQTPIFSKSRPFYLLPFGLAILGYFSPTTRFYGPIRFGYLEYSEHFTQAYKVLLDWWIVALLGFLPFPWLSFAFGVGIAAFSLAAWVRLSFLYRKEVRAIASQVARETSRAKVAAAAARDEACSFHRYKDQAIQAATAARRDAILSNTVRVTDFFDYAAHA